MATIFKPFTSAGDVQERIKFGETPECIHWDYKQTFNPHKKSDIAIDLAAFANSYGGSLLIGISDKQNELNLKVAHGLCDVENPEEIIRKLETDIRNMIKPYIKFDKPIVDVIDKKKIVIVNIHPLVQTVASVLLNSERKSYCFPYRTNYGNRYFEMHEVAKRMENLSRKNYLKVLEVLDGQNEVSVEIYPKPKNGGYAASYCSIKILNDNDHIFELDIDNKKMRLPYSAIEEIWDSGYVGKSVCLVLKWQVIYSDKLIIRK